VISGFEPGFRFVSATSRSSALVHPRPAELENLLWAIKTRTIPMGKAGTGAGTGLSWNGDQPAAHFCTFLVCEFTRILPAQHSVVLIHGCLPSSTSFSSICCCFRFDKAHLWSALIIRGLTSGAGDLCSAAMIDRRTVSVRKSWARGTAGHSGGEPAGHFTGLLVCEFARILPAQYSVVWIHGCLPFTSSISSSVVRRYIGDLTFLSDLTI